MVDGIAKPYVNQEELTEYIKQMKLKKTINGFDRTDVFNKIMDMQDICQQYIDQYEDILDEKDAHIYELSSEIQNLKENYKQEKDSIVKRLRLQLNEKTELTVKLYRELGEYSELLRKYKNQDSETTEKSIQKANTTARLIIEQAKINSELESLKFYEQRTAEKEKYKKWKLHTKTASHEILDNLKRIEEYITHLDKKLIENEKSIDDEEFDAEFDEELDEGLDEEFDEEFDEGFDAEFDEELIEMNN